MSITLTDGEFSAIRRIVAKCAEYEREDVVGCILKTGGFWDLPGEHQSEENDLAVTELANKLELSVVELPFLIKKKESLVTCVIKETIS